MMALLPKVGQSFMAHSTRGPLLLSFIWVQAWLSLPGLASELSLPAPMSHLYVWSKVWAVILLPSTISLIALTVELLGHRQTWGLGVAMIGLGADTLYLWHHIAALAHPPIAERWLAALMSLTSLYMANRAEQDNTAPALQIVSGAALLLAFVAPARWALIVAITVIIAGGAWVLKHPGSRTANR